MMVTEIAAVTAIVRISIRYYTLCEHIEN